MSVLPILWYWLVGAIFAGYAVLDGFDLGVGALHLLARTDEERRVMMNAIGPVWDGNEVWLVVGGGTLLAAFPPVYASVFSALYFLVMLLILAFIFRAASIEFRSRRPQALWRRTWDFGFWSASVLASLLLGIGLGNVFRGMPLDAQGNYVGTLAGLLNPYALLSGLTTLALFTMHGAIYLTLRTEGEIEARAARWARGATFVFVAALLALTVFTLTGLPRIVARFTAHAWLLVAPAVVAAAVIAVLVSLRRARYWAAFLASAVLILTLMLLAAISMYPVLVFARDPALNLTAFNSSSTPKSLTIMLVVAGIGLPLAAGYFYVLYRTFMGKVKLDAHSY